MNIKSFLRSAGIGISTIAVCALIYAATDTNLISEIRDEQELDKALKENKYTLVEFYNPTCPVCNAFKKKNIFPQAAQKLPSVKFIMISSDDAPDLHQKYGIQAFPTFIYFKDGTPFNKTVGYKDNPAFTNDVSASFKNGN